MQAFPAFPPPHALVSMGIMTLINEKTNRTFAFDLFLNLTIFKFDHKHLWFKKITKCFDKSILFIYLPTFRVCYTHYHLHLLHFIFTNIEMLTKL